MLPAVDQTSAADRSWRKLDRDPRDEGDGDGGGGDWRSSRRMLDSRHRTRRHLQPLRHRSRDLYVCSRLATSYFLYTVIGKHSVI